MCDIHNILRTASIYIRGYISRKAVSWRVVDGKFKPNNNTDLEDAMHLYTDTVLSSWGFIGKTSGEHMVDNAYRMEVARHRKLFRQYPMYDWDLSNVNDESLLQKWNSLKTQTRCHVNGCF